MSWNKVKIKEVLKQYRVQHIVQDDIEYKQVSILNNGSVVVRGNKIGKEIGRKRQFKIDLDSNPDTLIFTRQLLLQGSVGIASEDVNGCIVTENMPMFAIQTSKIDKEFLILFLKSEVFKSRIRKIELSGSAQKSIHERTFLDLEFTLPNINLQKIIVVELLKLKSNSDDISSEVTHQINLIKQLRQAFLREAMQGKLVKSTNTKETGQQLLAKIKTEKAKLIAEKKLKKEKDLAPISEDEIPFEIPEHWAWCRLGEILKEIKYGTSQSCDYDLNKNSAVLRIPNVSNGEITIEDLKYTNLSDKERTDLSLEENDILIVRSNGSRELVGKTALVKKELIGFCYAGYLIRLRYNSNLINSNYLWLATKSPFFRAMIETPLRTTVGINNINTVEISLLKIPLPPLHEQEQIVSKLEELMAFCEDLEQSIKESQGYNEMLLQQVLREALQPKVETKVISIQSRKIEKPLKTIIAGHIINLNNTKDFGRVKFQKLLYLTEYICKIDFDSQYIQKVAGPYDDILIKTIEADFNRLRFFKVVQDKTDNKRVHYTALPGAQELDNLFLENFLKESVIINNTLLKFRPLSWGECELVATLYAVWNNRIIKNEPLTDDLLYSDFMAWDKQKIKYKDIFHKWLFWMKEERIIPDGWGKYIEKNIMS